MLDNKRANLSDGVLDIHRVTTHEPNRSRTAVKRAAISAASAFGFRPVGRKWIEAFSALNGTFERTGFELSFYVAMLVFSGGVILALGGFGISQYRQHGWTPGATMLVCYEVFMACLFYYLISQAGVRYVFGTGAVSAYNAWGRLLWSENLTGLKDVVFFSGRGNTSVRLIWPDRKRSLMLFDSIREAVDSSLESAKRSAEEKTAPTVEDGAVPSWTCPHCDEENPGNFNECWKCQRIRTEGSE
jgi:hypothetical protein